MMLRAFWQRWLRGASKARRCQAARHFRPQLEVLEDRTVPSTFTVLNTNDSGAGSLRQAIINANSTAHMGTPTPASPSGSLSTDQVTFTWSAVALAAHYDVWLTDLTTGSGGVVGSSTTTSLVDATALSPGHSYRWWVRADSSNGTAGPWSLPTDFAIMETMWKH